MRLNTVIAVSVLTLTGMLTGCSGSSEPAPTAAPVVPIVATPTFSLPSGTYSAGQTIAITDSTPNASIYYTTDGSVPTVSSSLYSGPLSLTSQFTLQAIAAASNDHNSNIASASYSILANTSMWVSASTGSDGNPGTQTSPFQTIGKCLSVATPGTTCNVLAGVYGETIVPPTNGITITGAGTSSVTVTTADTVTNWQIMGTGLYSAAVTVPAAANQTSPLWPGYDLFYNGVEVPQAQWPAPASNPMYPNWSSMAAGTAETTSGSTTTGTIYDPNLPAFTITPATTVHIWSGSDPWAAYYGIPSASSAGSVQYQGFQTSTLSYAQPGGLYYITGAKEFLTTNTWFFDAQNGILYWQPPLGVNPNTADIRFKQRTVVADLSNRSNTVISNITFLGGGLITNSSSNSNILDTLVFYGLSTFNRASLGGSSTTNAYSIGVLIEGNNNVLRNSTISQNTMNGVTVFGNGHTILNNLIHDVNSVGDFSAGISVGNSGTTKDVVIQNNTIYNVGRSAIHFSLGTPTYNVGVSDISVTNNHLYNTMLLSTDGGAIYGCCNQQTTGSVISNNWIHSEVSPFTIPFPKNTSTENAWAAFYWDNGSGGITFTNNIVWDSFPEIVLNGSPSSASDNISVTDNTDPDNTYGCSATISRIASASNLNVSANKFYYDVYLNQVTQTGTTTTNNLPGQTGATNVTGVGCSFTGCNNGASPPSFPANVPSSGVTPVCVHKAP